MGRSAFGTPNLARRCLAQVNSPHADETQISRGAPCANNICARWPRANKSRYSATLGPQEAVVEDDDRYPLLSLICPGMCILILALPDTSAHAKHQLRNNRWEALFVTIAFRTDRFALEVWGSYRLTVQDTSWRWRETRKNVWLPNLSL